MNEAMIAGVSGMVGFLITWGALRGKVQELERRTEAAEKALEQQRDLIYNLRDIYVSQQHFNQIMESMRDSHREVKEDVKKVIEILSARD